MALGVRGCAFVQMGVRPCTFGLVTSVFGFIMRDLCWFAIVRSLSNLCQSCNVIQPVSQCVFVCAWVCVGDNLLRVEV